MADVAYIISLSMKRKYPQRFPSEPQKEKKRTENRTRDRKSDPVSAPESLMFTPNNFSDAVSRHFGRRVRIDNTSGEETRDIMRDRERHSREQPRQRRIPLPLRQIG